MAGFSLVELTVVLAIVGIISAGSVLVFSEQRVNAKWQESDAKLKLVKSSLIKYVRLNKYIPCPDRDGDGFGDRTLNVDGTVATVAAQAAIPAVPGTQTSPTIPAIPAIPAVPTFDIPVDICTFDNGGVPFADLELSQAAVQDSWGNPILYAVSQDATNSDRMVNCPLNTACFFNRNTAPAYDSTTLPIKNNLGNTNLKICSTDACDATTAGDDVIADGLLAVLVAFNENGFDTWARRAANTVAGLADAERENANNDLFFVQTEYSNIPYYDDLIIKLSANEIKERRELDSVEIVATPPATPPVVNTINDIIDLGDGSLGSSGTNIGTDDVEWDSAQRNVDFGSDAAGMKIVLNFDSHATGTWDQPASATSSTTSDTAYVEANGDRQADFAYNFLDDTQDGVELESWTVAQTGTYTEADANGDLINVYREAGDEATSYADYWDESHETIVTLDENGQVDLTFAVGTTATYETIDFTNIKLTLYYPPPPVPDFPLVTPIETITETERFSR